MKKAYLIHGWKASPGSGFFPWLQKQLEENGYSVAAPALPHPNVPQVEEWIRTLKMTIQNTDEETLIIAHSLGAKAALFFLDGLPEGSKVGRVILVAPPLLVPENLSVAETFFSKPWFVRPMDAARIKSHVSDFLMFFSDNDHYIALENEARARELFGVRTIIEPGMGHYSRESHDGVEATVPQVLVEALKPLPIESHT